MSSNEGDSDLSSSADKSTTTTPGSATTTTTITTTTTTTSTTQSDGDQTVATRLQRWTPQGLFSSQSARKRSGSTGSTSDDSVIAKQLSSNNSTKRNRPSASTTRTIQKRDGASPALNSVRAEIAKEHCKTYEEEGLEMPKGSFKGYIYCKYCKKDINARLGSIKEHLGEGVRTDKTGIDSGAEHRKKKNDAFARESRVLDWKQFCASTEGLPGM